MGPAWANPAASIDMTAMEMGIKGGVLILKGYHSGLFSS